ncbi:MAG: M56 family metallopeptidase, partial [Actinobacteria bacterium]|nr:M56 family metallopeptidase [Actinomycetota bacterium]
LLSRGSPRLLAWFGILTLFGISASFVALLGAMVVPSPLPLADLPRAVEVCVDAVVRLVVHPLKHWPSILAAVLLLALFLRALIASIVTVRDARRARLPGTELPGERAARQRYVGSLQPEVRVLTAQEPVAYTTGLIHPQTVVSTGLLQALDDRERAAVLAHERAHARRNHTLALFAASLISRAFGFIPSVRSSLTFVVTALEATADEVAARHVGDPLVVAQALTSLAKQGLQDPRTAPGMATGNLTYRVRRLTRGRPIRRSGPLAGVAVLLAIASLAAQGVAFSAGRTALAREALAVQQHATCHAPHPASQAL